MAVWATVVFEICRVLCCSALIVNLTISIVPVLCVYLTLLVCMPRITVGTVSTRDWPRLSQRVQRSLGDVVECWGWRPFRRCCVPHVSTSRDAEPTSCSVQCDGSSISCTAVEQQGTDWSRVCKLHPYYRVCNRYTTLKSDKRKVALTQLKLCFMPIS